MRASKFEFRLRMPINAAIIILGFASPWIEALGIGRRITTLEWLPLELSRTGLVNFTLATPLVILLVALIAACAAIMRGLTDMTLGDGRPASHLLIGRPCPVDSGAILDDGPEQGGGRGFESSAAERCSPLLVTATCPRCSEF